MNICHVHIISIVMNKDFSQGRKTFNPFASHGCTLFFMRNSHKYSYAKHTKYIIMLEWTYIFLSFQNYHNFSQKNPNLFQSYRLFEENKDIRIKCRLLWFSTELDCIPFFFILFVRHLWSIHCYWGGERDRLCWCSNHQQSASIRLHRI